MNPLSFTDPTYLREVQYPDESNFNARYELHKQFSVNLYGFYRWIYDLIDFEDNCTILELGSGPGYLWWENRDRLHHSWNITVSDVSDGMLSAAKRNLGTTPFLFKYAIVDAQSIPVAPETIDIVIANHMLYHMLSLNKAVSEIHRILKPNGLLLASTNGRDHLRELEELCKGVQTCFDQDSVEKIFNAGTLKHFSLENGMEILLPWFSCVEIVRYQDALFITEVESLKRWLHSFGVDDPTQSAIDEFSEVTYREIAANGHIYIQKDTGIFKAIR